YEKGLIYRGDRIINWCPCCGTAISNAEVEYEDRASHLWHIRYPLADGSGSIVVATTRPETMLGDTAVAVHPDDARYREMVGKTVLLPLMNREIPIIADSYVDPEFGTGAVKITPAHDPNDYEMALRHDLPMPGVIGEDGRMTGAAGAYAGMAAVEARERVVADLTALGLLVRTQDYEHSVGACYRCGSTVEPLISKQWFVSMKPLAEPAIREVREGGIRFVPERFAKVYFNWMENIQDWCISRQLWWGHRIPAWHCNACENVVVAREAPAACPRCGGAVSQDEDVLDTWFSSALWPFSTLGWPDRTPELDYFYPTDVLVTGYDIIFFWVARMIFSGLEHMGQKPFHTVLIHGLVRDAQGRKMSKSLGNGIDPLDIIEQYGADALRFSLTIGSAPGNDMRFYDEKVEAARNFANKIWNASRFALMNVREEEPIPVASAKLNISDRWILSRLQQVIGEVTDNLERYELGMACQKIYDFIWSELCDWYIEMTKQRLYEESGEDRQAALATLVHVLGDSLRLLHPFMPFVTEQIWGALPGERGSIMVSPWPEPDSELVAQQETALVEDMMELVRLARGIRAELKVPAGRKSAMLLAPAQGRGGDLAQMESFIMRLASASRISYIASAEEAPRGAVSAVGRAAQLFIPLGELIDVDREKERVTGEIEKTRREIARGETMLANPGFIAKA
ncbi:MAG: valine--tRNA ligase, partial [Clostridiales bacterium]|nr:valine--tRNA ligase [Clostridiales bacterium]